MAVASLLGVAVVEPVELDPASRRRHPDAGGFGAVALPRPAGLALGLLHHRPAESLGDAATMRSND